MPVSSLDDREQRYAYVAAGFAAASSVGLWAPSYDDGTAVVLAGIGLVMAAFLAIAAQRRKRLVTGMAAVLLAFGPWGMAWVVGLPFLVLAGWLALKSARLNPRMAPAMDDPGENEAQPGAGHAEARRSPRTPRWRRSTSSGDPVASSDGPARRAAPPASKRYTPPQRPR